MTFVTLVTPSTVACAPLAAAAVVIAALDRVPRRVTQWFTIAVSALTLAGTVAIAMQVARFGPIVEWIGGWHPGNRVGLGIALAADPAASGAAVLVAITVTAAIVFSTDYFDDAGAIFYVLILATLGGMIAFAYAADLFDVFVWYEVFSVSAYALAAYRTESAGAYKGALQFALTSSVAGLFFLIGIIMLEGKTGELNLAAIGHSLNAAQAAGPLVTTAFACIAVALFTRGALAPFGFWFDEVHAEAPAPLCVILSGAMVPLALYGFARIYWTVFAGVLPASRLLASITIAAGVLSAAYGTIMALRESRLKRKLAHASVAHSGIAVVWIGHYTTAGLAAAFSYATTYAAAAAALFCCIATLRSTTGEYDAHRLRGRGRRLPVTAAAFGIAVLTIAAACRSALATAAAPGVHAVVLFAATAAGLVAAATGGAFGAVFVRTFVLPPPHPAPQPHTSPPWFLLVPSLLLSFVSIACATSTAPLAARAAAFMRAPGAYRSAIMQPSGNMVPMPPLHGVPVAEPAAIAAAIAVAIVVLNQRKELRLMRVRLARSVVVQRLRAVNNGDSGAYIGWIAAGAIVLGTAYAYTGR